MDSYAQHRRRWYLNATEEDIITGDMRRTQANRHLPKSIDTETLPSSVECGTNDSGAAFTPPRVLCLPVTDIVTDIGLLNVWAGLGCVRGGLWDGVYSPKLDGA